MRWKVKPPKPKPPRPNVGDTRSSKVFLWFPEIINGKWVWLERVIKHEEYRQINNYYLFVEGSYPAWEWRTTHFELFEK